MQMGVVFDTPEGIEYYKLCVIEYGLKLQQMGVVFRHPRGRSPLQILRKDYGLPVKTVAEGLELVPYLIVARRRLEKGPLIRG
jgi:hypothetical protein